MTFKAGDVLSEWEATIERGKVREFARAVHDPRAGAEPPVPPLTFPIVLSAPFVERLVSDLIPLDRKRTVHGEQEYEYLRALKVGQSVKCRARLVRDEVKQGRRGGTMRVVTVEVELRDRTSGEIFGYERMTSIEQSAPA